MLSIAYCAIHTNSSLLKTAHVGLLGEFNIISRVFGVTHFFRSDNCTLNSFSSYKGTYFATALQNSIAEIYVGNHGSGMITSSPELTRHLTA